MYVDLPEWDYIFSGDSVDPKNLIVGFFRGGAQGEGGNWGTLRIPAGKIRGITTPTLGILLITCVKNPLKNMALPQLHVFEDIGTLPPND